MQTSETTIDRVLLDVFMNNFAILLTQFNGEDSKAITIHMEMTIDLAEIYYGKYFLASFAIITNSCNITENVELGIGIGKINRNNEETRFIWTRLVYLYNDLSRLSQKKS